MGSCSSPEATTDHWGTAFLRLEEAEEPEIRAGLPAVPLATNLQVAQGNRSRGIGSDLLGQMEQYVRTETPQNRIALAVFPSNPRARQLYERLGYSDWGHGTVQCWDTVLEDDHIVLRVPDSERAHVLVKDLADTPDRV